MRSPHVKVEDWLFGDDSKHSVEAAEQPFDSFAPMSSIRRALQSPTKQPVTQGPHDCTRVLVAEADPYQRRILRVLLASPRISSIQVEDGQSAVDLLALRSFDLLLLDMDLPNMTGVDVIRWVRRSLLAWGPSVSEAFLMLWTLQRACDVQIASGAAGGVNPIRAGSLPADRARVGPGREAHLRGRVRRDGPAGGRARSVLPGLKD